MVAKIKRKRKRRKRDPICPCGGGESCIINRRIRE